MTIKKIEATELKLLLDEKLVRLFCITENLKVEGEFIFDSEVILLDDLSPQKMIDHGNKKIVLYTNTPILGEKITSKIISDGKLYAEIDFHYFEGGIEAWKAAKFSTERTIPSALYHLVNLPFYKQINVCLGSVMLILVLLGYIAGSAFFFLVAIIGAGLIFSASSENNVLENWMAKMPWNKGSLS